MTEEILDSLNRMFPLMPCKASEYETFQMSGMDFEAKGYEAENMGHVSVMKASGMGGAVKMESLIVSPFSCDAPLFSLDLIDAPGKHTLLMELYDTLTEIKREEAAYLAVKERFETISDLPEKANWYDGIQYRASVRKEAGDDQTEQLKELIRSYSSVYLDELGKAPQCDAEKKKMKADAYRDGLLTHGGPATDAFLKTWGIEKTGKLFTEVLFG